MTILLREPTAELCGEIAAYRREMLEAGSLMGGCGSLGSTEDPAVWLAQVESLRQEATCPAPWVPATQLVALSETGRVLGMIQVLSLIHICPQRKKDKQVKDMLNNLKVTDRSCTIGGIYGTITGIRDDTITLAVGKDNLQMVVARWAIRSVEEISIENDAEALN